MTAYKLRHSMLFRATALAMVCLFLVNGMTWADIGQGASGSTLAASSQLANAEFREKFATGSFLLAIEGTKHYIEAQVKTEKEIFKTDWKSRRTESAGIDDLSIKGRIKGAVAGLDSVVFVKVAGLLSSTGQPACVDMTCEIETSKEFNGRPVVYIDSTLFDTPDRCIQKHEIDEALQWEDLRVNVLKIADKYQMGSWIRRHIDSPDKKLKGTPYEGMSSRHIARMFHGYSYPLRSFYKNLLDTTDFDYGYIRNMLAMYGHDENSRSLNIAAGAEQAGLEHFAEGLKEIRPGMPPEAIYRRFKFSSLPYGSELKAVWNENINGDDITGFYRYLAGKIPALDRGIIAMHFSMLLLNIMISTLGISSTRMRGALIGLYAEPLNRGNSWEGEEVRIAYKVYKAWRNGESRDRDLPGEMSRLIDQIGSSCGGIPELGDIFKILSFRVKLISDLNSNPEMAGIAAKYESGGKDPETADAEDGSEGGENGSISGEGLIAVVKNMVGDIASLPDRAARMQTRDIRLAISTFEKSMLKIMHLCERDEDSGVTFFNEIFDIYMHTVMNERVAKLYKTYYPSYAMFLAGSETKVKLGMYEAALSIVEQGLDMMDRAVSMIKQKGSLTSGEREAYEEDQARFQLITSKAALGTGDIDEAVRIALSLVKVLREKIEKKEVRDPGICQDYLETVAQLAEAYAESASWEKARQYTDEMLSLIYRPNLSFDNRRSLFSVMMLAGDIYLKGRNAFRDIDALLVAKRCAKEAEVLDPGSSEAKILRAWIMFEEDDIEGAKRELEQISGIDNMSPRSFIAYARIARAAALSLFDSGREEEARQICAKVTDLFPNEIWSYAIMPLLKNGFSAVTLGYDAALKDIGGILEDRRRKGAFVLETMVNEVMLTMGKAMREGGRLDFRAASGQVNDYARISAEMFDHKKFSEIAVYSEVRFFPRKFRESFMAVARMMLEQDRSLVSCRAKYNILRYFAYLKKRGESPAWFIEQLEKLRSALPGTAEIAAERRNNVKNGAGNKINYERLKDDISAFIDELVKTCSPAERLGRAVRAFESGQYKESLAEAEAGLAAPAESVDADIRDRLNMYKEASGRALEAGANYSAQRFRLAALQYERAASMLELAGAKAGDALDYKYARARRMKDAMEAYQSGEFDRALQIAGEVGDAASRDFSKRVDFVRRAENANDISFMARLSRQYPDDPRISEALSRHKAGKREYRKKLATFDDMAADVREILALDDIAREDFVRVMDHLKRMRDLIGYNNPFGTLIFDAAKLAYERGIYGMSSQIARFGLSVVPQDRRRVRDDLMVLARNSDAQAVSEKLRRHSEILDCHFQADNLREKKKLDERGTTEYSFSVIRKNPDGATLEISGLTYQSANGSMKGIGDVRTAVNRGESYVLKIENGDGKIAQFVLKAVYIEEGKAVFNLESNESAANAFADIPERKGTLRKLRDPSLKERRDVVFGHLAELRSSLGEGKYPSTGDRFADILLGLQPPGGNSVGDMRVTFKDGRIAQDPKQRKAVEASLDTALPLVLIQGPPGTGKTSVIVEIVRQFRSKGRKVLVVSQSNPAVDNVAKRLLAIQGQGENIPFARVGNNKKAVDPEVCDSDAYNNKKDILETMRARNNGCVVLGTIGGLSSDNDMKKMEAYYGKFDVVIVEEAGRATLAETLVSLSRADPRGKVILVGDHNQLPPYGIDATQVEETKEELERHGYRKDRLSGIFSAGKVREFKTSPFEISWEYGRGFKDDVHKHFLAVNRRSVPVLTILVSDLFYGGRIQVDPEKNGEPEEDAFRLIDYTEDEPLAGREDHYRALYEKEIGTSYGNLREVDITLNEFDRLLNQQKDGSYRYGVKDITIITPFAPQRAILKQAFAVKAIMNKLRRPGTTGQPPLTEEDGKRLTAALRDGSNRAADAIRTLGQADPDPATKEALVKAIAAALIFDVDTRYGDRSVMPEDIEKLGLFDVETVDSIQGSENKAVILSLVRSNTIGQIGFMGTADGLQRLTVAFSRAQEKFTVIGDFTNTLTQARYTPRNPDPRSWFQRERRQMTGKAQIAFKKAVDYHKALRKRLSERPPAKGPDAVSPPAGAVPAETAKGSPAAFLEDVRDNLLERALGDKGFAFRDIAPIRKHHASTVYKEIRILISLGILERVRIDGNARLRFSAAIRALDVKRAAMLIDAINGIEYKIGTRDNPLQRYDIPDEKDRLFVKGLVKNAIGIEEARYLPDILPPAGTDDGRYYEIRYNDRKLKDYASKTGMSADSFKALLEAYVRLLQVRLGGVKRVKLISSENIKQPLISAACYSSLAKTQTTLIGEGHVNVDGAEIDSHSTLRIIDMANMAFAVSNIPLKPGEGELGQYSRLISYIQDQYSELTGKKISLEEMLKDGRVITLPAIKPVPPEKLREYYELTVKQLAQAA